MSKTPKNSQSSSSQSTASSHQPLLTPTSVALSLSPPRSPPHGSLARKILTEQQRRYGGIDIRRLYELLLRYNAYNAHSDAVDGVHQLHGAHVGIGRFDEEEELFQSHSLAARISQVLGQFFGSPNTSVYGDHGGQQIVREFHLPHPHLPSIPDVPDRLTRYLGAILPLEWQHSFRDSGNFRALANGLIKTGLPLMAVGDGFKGFPAVSDFLELSHSPSFEEVMLAQGNSSPDGKETKGENSTKRNNNVKSHGNNSNNKGSRGRKRKWTKNTFHYGSHSMQYIDLFLPAFILHKHDSDGSTKNDPTISSSHVKDEYSNQQQQRDRRVPVRGILFFVHGGAWGSNEPWMYRLVAKPFLEVGFGVAIVGYRTYPDALNVVGKVTDGKDESDRTRKEMMLQKLSYNDEYVEGQDGGKFTGQMGDLFLAWDKLKDSLDEYVTAAHNFVGNVIMGHSSGAHIALLMLVEMINEQMEAQSRSNPQQMTRGAQNKTILSRHPPTHAQDQTSKSNQNTYPWKPDYFVGLSGPYDISHHFDYEAGRGVEQISPMGAICGHTRENFKKSSPAWRLWKYLAQFREHGELGSISEPVGASTQDDTTPEPLSPLTAPPSHDTPTIITHTLQSLSPPVLLVHGIEDSTVPFTATSETAHILRNCGLHQTEEMYLEKVGHQDVIMHFMLGGRAKDLVLDWILGWKERKDKKTVDIRSRL